MRLQLNFYKIICKSFESGSFIFFVRMIHLTLILQKGRIPLIARAHYSYTTVCLLQKLKNFFIGDNYFLNR